MGYKKANNVLPRHLLLAIQEYIDSRQRALFLLPNKEQDAPGRRLRYEWGKQTGGHEYENAIYRRLRL